MISTHIHSDGKFENLLHVPAGISSGYENIQQEAAFIQMKGNEVFRKAVGTLGSIARETLDGNNIDQSDIAWLVPHQANLRIITAAAKKLGLPMDRVIVTVDEHANTSSASIPLALDVAVRDGRIQPRGPAVVRGFRGRVYLGVGPGSLLTGSRRANGITGLRQIGRPSPRRNSASSSLCQWPWPGVPDRVPVPPARSRR